MHLVDAADPWFRRHLVAAGAVAVALFTVATVLPYHGGEERDAAIFLFALPIALIAIAFGLVGGVAAAVISAGMLWGHLAGSPAAALTTEGWAVRIVPLGLLGLLVGMAADALEEAARVRTELAVACARRRDAAEVNDAIIQRLAVAKWQAEAAGADAVADAVAEVIEVTEDLVSSLLAGTEMADRLRSRTAPPAEWTPAPDPSHSLHR